MATLYTQRYIVVMRQGFASKANTASKLVDTQGGERTFSVPLRLAGDATNTVRARWCSWALTPAEATALRDRLKEQGLLDQEVVVVTRAQRGTWVFDGAARAGVFDAREGTGWTPQEVLQATGLDTLAVPINGQPQSVVAPSQSLAPSPDLTPGE